MGWMGEYLLNLDLHRDRSQTHPESRPKVPHGDQESRRVQDCPPLRVGHSQSWSISAPSPPLSSTWGPSRNTPVSRRGVLGRVGGGRRSEDPGKGVGGVDVGVLVQGVFQQDRKQEGPEKFLGRSPSQGIPPASFPAFPNPTLGGGRRRWTWGFLGRGVVGHTYNPLPPVFLGVGEGTLGTLCLDASGTSRHSRGSKTACLRCHRSRDRPVSKLFLRLSHGCWRRSSSKAERVGSREGKGRDPRPVQ